MSWYSDNEDFDEYEGCGPCNFRTSDIDDVESLITCAKCDSGDYENIYSARDILERHYPDIYEEILEEECL